MKTVGTYDEIGPEKCEQIYRKIIDRGENGHKDVQLQIKMMQKLHIEAIPDLEFDTGDHVYKFNDLY
jgi:hypothetical protein